MDIDLRPLIVGQSLNLMFVLGATGLLDLSAASTLFLSGLASSLLYARSLMKWIRAGVSLVSPVLIYIVSSAFRLGLGIAYAGLALPIVISHPEYEYIFSLGRAVPINHMGEGLAILLLGEIGILAGFLLLQSKQVAVQQVVQTGRDAGRLWLVGLAGFVASMTLIVLARAAVPIGALGRFGPLIMDFAAPAGIFLMLQGGMTIGKKRWLHYSNLIPLGLLIVLVAISLSSYMKKSVLLALLPLILFALQNSDRFGVRKKIKRLSKVHILAFSVACASFLLFISAYAELRRPDFWVGEGSIAKVRSERPPVLPYLGPALLAVIPGTDEFSKAHRFPDRGGWYFLRRISHADEASWAFTHVDRFGWRKGDLLGDFLATITPRIFWPDKRQIYWGRELAVLVGAARSAEVARTSFGLPMAGAYYWIGGWGAVFGGMLLSGVVLSFTWRLYAPYFGRDLFATIVGMSLIVLALSWFEGEFFGGMEHFVYFIVVYPLVRLTGPWTVPVRRLRFRSGLSA